MFKTKITRREDTLSAIAEQLDGAALLMSARARTEVMPLVEALKTEISTEPGPSHRPVIWTSERQRRAYFATNGFGRGIPTVRTRKLSQGWQVELIADSAGGEILVYNDVPYVRYVQGKDQQIQHYATGWVEAIPTVSTYETKLDDALVEAWFDVCEHMAGGQ